MELSEFAKKLSEKLQRNTIKIYLILSGIILTIFAIWFSNVGLMPFKNLGDFAFFVILIAVFAFYRPGWSFVLFVASLVLENVNLAPMQLGLAIRPYQLLGALTLLAVILRFFAGRKVVEFSKLKWHDVLPILFVLGGFLSAMGATNKAASFKQSIVAASFVALYFLVRMYVQSLSDLKRIAPFFLSGGLLISSYAIWQNVRFLSGAASFEVMPGRPNATFTEPDWFGVYLVFLFTSVLTIIYLRSKRTRVSSLQFPVSKKSVILSLFNFRNVATMTNYVLLFVISIALILTVSRSAWIGAILMIMAFLKITLLYGESNERSETKEVKFWSGIVLMLKKPWCWRAFLKAFRNVVTIILISLGIVFVFRLTNFQLGSRAQSTGGLQKITIACQPGFDSVVPQTIGSIDELEKYQCRHINLEDIEKEKAQGNLVSQVYRPDPNVGIRARIYRTVFEQIRKHPIFGIGWGSVSKILGTDERGAGLNTSNIFLEIWLGSGLLGFIAFLLLLGRILVSSYIRFVKSQGSDPGAVFAIMGLFAIIIPNLFNSGIFLGFLWAYLAVAAGLLSEKNS